MTPTAWRPLPLMLLVVLAAQLAAAASSAAPHRWFKSLSILIGTVSSVDDATHFTLAGGTVVATDERTELVGIAEVSALLPGDLVHVDGTRNDSAPVLAFRVQLLQSAAPAEIAEGEVALLAPPDRLVLADGTVGLVHSATEYVNLGGFGALSLGDRVRLSGGFDSWTGTMQVDRLELLAAAGARLFSFQGAVFQVDPPDRVVLEDGAVLRVSAATVLANMTGLEGLAPGDLLWIEAMTTEEPSVYDALALRLVSLSDEELSFVAVVAATNPPDRFSTTEGDTVVVGASTVFIGASGLEDLAPGDAVRIEGAPTGEPHSIVASLVQLLGGGGADGEGLVTTAVGAIAQLLPPASFAFEDGTEVEVDSATSWLGGITGYGDLVSGTIVRASLRWLQDGSHLALAVEALGMARFGATRVEGLITSVDLSTPRFQVESGEWVVFDSGTVLDGDVDEPSAIAVGMWLEADCVALDPGSSLALRALVEAHVAWEDATPWAGPAGGAGYHQALVTLMPGVEVAAVAARHGAVLAGRLPGTLVHLFEWAQPITFMQVQALLDDLEVDAVDANYLFHDPETIRRRMPVVDLRPSGDRFQTQTAVAKAGIRAAHQRSCGAGTMVAIVDTGVDPLHPLLRHRIAGGGWDFVDDDPQPWETTNLRDDDGDGDIDEAAGHGTFVAGLTLLAAPSTSILPLRALDDDGNGTTFAICQAVLLAMDRGADVINMSFAFEQRSRVLDRLLDEAAARGIALVAGAGNDGTSELSFPAVDHRVISVAALDEVGALSAFSNFGAAVTLAAPGEHLYSGLADQLFGTWSGTSMAAPLVSGAIAVLRQANPSISPDELRAALVQSADPLLGDALGVAGALRVDAALALVPGRARRQGLRAPATPKASPSRGCAGLERAKLWGRSTDWPGAAPRSRASGAAMEVPLQVPKSWSASPLLGCTRGRQGHRGAEVGEGAGAADLVERRDRDDSVVHRREGQLAGPVVTGAGDQGDAARRRPRRAGGRAPASACSKAKDMLMTSAPRSWPAGPPGRWRRWCRCRRRPAPAGAGCWSRARQEQGQAGDKRPRDRQPRQCPRRRRHP